MSTKNGTEIACKVCGTLFYVPKKRLGTAEFCSRVCLYKGRRPRRSAPDSFITMACARCGQTFQAKASHAHRRKFCSLKCRGEEKTDRTSVDYVCQHCSKPFRRPPSKRRRGVEYCSKACAQRGMAETKRTWYTKADGYIASGFTINGRSREVLQHRYVMEERLGRPLKPYENVHHKNGVRSDNRPENLEVWITRQPKGQRPEDVISWAIDYLRSLGYTVHGPTSNPLDLASSTPAPVL